MDGSHGLFSLLRCGLNCLCHDRNLNMLRLVAARGIKHGRDLCVNLGKDKLLLESEWLYM